MRALRALTLVIGMCPLIPAGGLAGQDPEPVVHAILFYHTGCPHCRQLITEHLIPLQNRYGNRLVLLAMDTSQQWANNIYWEAIRFYQLPQDDWVVPILIVADQVMVGGIEIPARLPGIIEAGLASGGIDLPDFPALITFLREQNALDLRYPDRRIVRRAESPEVEAETPEAEAPETGAPAARAPVEGDTVERPEPEEVAQTEGVSGEAVPSSPEAREGGEDTLSTPGETPSPSVASELTDTAAASRTQAPAEGRVGSERERRPGASEPPARSSGSGMGPMDLEGAARELESMTMWDRFNVDPAGSSLSVLVLILMLVSLAVRGYPPKVRVREWPDWIVPVLVLVGAGVASYLSFIEVTEAEAVCGPVGDCNTVNQSDYAFLFGVLPVGLLGLIGYGLMLLLWLFRRAGSAALHRWATLGLWAGALAGTLFSVYLTFLEPFVIAATCIWCLTSAVVMTLLLWSTAPWASGVWDGSDGQEAPGLGT